MSPRCDSPRLGCDTHGGLTCDARCVMCGEEPCCDVPGAVTPGRCPWLVRCAVLSKSLRRLCPSNNAAGCGHRHARSFDMRSAAVYCAGVQLLCMCHQLCCGSRFRWHCMSDLGAS